MLFVLLVQPNYYFETTKLTIFFFFEPSFIQYFTEYFGARRTPNRTRCGRRSERTVSAAFKDAKGVRIDRANPIVQCAYESDRTYLWIPFDYERKEGRVHVKGIVRFAIF